jgi:hypothetical protein
MGFTGVTVDSHSLQYVIINSNGQRVHQETLYNPRPIDFKPKEYSYDVHKLLSIIFPILTGFLILSCIFIACSGLSMYLKANYNKRIAVPTNYMAVITNPLLESTGDATFEATINHYDSEEDDHHGDDVEELPIDQDESLR